MPIYVASFKFCQLGKKESKNLVLGLHMISIHMKRCLLLLLLPKDTVMV